MSNDLNQVQLELKAPLTQSRRVGRPRKNTQTIERVTLSEEVVKRLDQWSAQARGARPGVDISRRDLVNWLILSHSEVLSSSEEKALSDEYYDELRFIQFAVKELKAAKLRGENVTLQELMGSAATLPEIAGKLAPRKRRQRKTVSDGNAASEVCDAEVVDQQLPICE